jgi:hypothetical protein
MKKIYTILLSVVLTMGLSAQELDSLKRIMNHDDPAELKEEQNTETVKPVEKEDDGEEVNIKVLEKEVVRVIENGDTTTVKIGKNGKLQVTDQPDSTSIRVGDKEIRIVERNSDTNIHIDDIDECDEEKVINPKFRGHWAGVEWGINNFLNDNNSIARNESDWFMDLNTGRSWAVNINFAQYSIGFGTSHVGMLTGLGLEYNNYFFDHANTIIEENDFVAADSLTGNIAKSKLTSSFLRVPVILEFQFPNTIRSKRLFLSAGLVGGIKLGSHTKVVYKDDGGKNKDKNNDDFNINPFRFGLTARLGFGNCNVFGDYYFTPMFVEAKGPALHPFTLGIAMTF